MLCGWLGASAPHPLPRTLSEMPQTQMRAGSCLKVVRTDGLRGSTDPQTHGDERPSASGCCARVLDGAGGLVGVRHAGARRAIECTRLSCLHNDRAGAHTRAQYRPKRAGTPPRSPRKASRQPGRAARSFLGWNNTSSVLFLDISMLTSRERGELTGIMPSGRLHHTYSTLHTG